jgi:hypothetical protein
MTSPNDVPSIYIIKHRRDNQEVGHSVSDKPGLIVALTYKGGKYEYGCIPVLRSAAIGH